MSAPAATDREEKEGRETPRPRSRRLLRLAVALAVVGALATSPWWWRPALASLAFFRVRKVEIEGARYLAPSDLIATRTAAPGAAGSPKPFAFNAKRAGALQKGRPEPLAFAAHRR